MGFCLPSLAALVALPHPLLSLPHSGCPIRVLLRGKPLENRDGDSLCRALSQLEKINREEANAIPLPRVHNVRQPKCLQLEAQNLREA